jgi:hypothetical protein
MKEREKSFVVSLQKSSSSIPPYNALIDRNMCHYFENRMLQHHLLRTGQIDLTGRVVELEKNKFKLTVLDKEFKKAEEEELKRQADEAEMRYRIQRKRIMELEKTRKETLIGKLRKEKEFAKTILQTVRPATSLPSVRNTPARRHSPDGYQSSL